MWGMGKDRERQESYRMMIYRERLEICLRCPRIRKVLGRPNCSVCKCFVEAKTFLLGQRCPEGRW